MALKDQPIMMPQQMANRSHGRRKVQGCPSSVDLFELSQQSDRDNHSSAFRHLDNCPRCAFNLRVFRAAWCLQGLPIRWTVRLGNALQTWDTSRSDVTHQLLGHINFEAKEFFVCHEDEWLPSTLAIRVNLVFDEEMEFFSLTLLDVPAAVESISLMTSTGLLHLRHNEEEATFEILLPDDDSPHDFACHFTDIRSLLVANRFQLLIDMSSEVANRGDLSSEDNVLDLLHDHGAIERAADYVLPCGRHSDTYVNIGALCSHEEAMQLVAAKLDFLFWDTPFDTVLANGWAMSLIARRLASSRRAQGPHRPITHALCEGYDEPILLDDISRGSHVLLLVDVIVTGQLAHRLKRMIEAAGAQLVGIAVVVKPLSAALPSIDQVRVLCEVEMDIVDTQSALCTRCNLLEQRVYNPIAGCMTTRSKSPRSPTQFLATDANARELWQYVDKVGAYEHHRREGDTHYIGFIDTRKLLESRQIGLAIIDKLVGLFANSAYRPTVLLTPHRSRATFLAKKMSRAIDSQYGKRPKIISAIKNRKTAQWQLPRSKEWALSNESVCIVDTAAAHGRTVDQLITLAEHSGAREVGAAVLLSRLTPPCEEAFQLRLHGHFYRLYSLPVRPVVIRGDSVDVCPVCRRKEAIRRFAVDADIEGLENWVEGLFKSRRFPSEPVRQPRERQQLLFESDYSFLSMCGPATASGVTLHALGASSNNGSAPLALPELADESIPWRARATMVENLPSGVLEWTGSTLTADLICVLTKGNYPSIWKATANLLSREGSDVWLDHLGSLLMQLQVSRQRTTETFWNHMACNTYLVAADNNTRAELRERIDDLLRVQHDQATESGLRRMKEVLCD